MRKFVVAVATLVAACTSAEPVKFLYKPNSTISDKQAALDQCRIASFRDIPQTVVSEQRGGYSNPGTLQCSTIGGITNCNRIGAVNIPARTETYDVNAELRARYIDRCLESAGYKIYPLSQCSSASYGAPGTLSRARAVPTGSLLSGLEPWLQPLRPLS